MTNSITDINLDLENDQLIYLFNVQVLIDND